MQTSKVGQRLNTRQSTCRHDRRSVQTQALVWKKKQADSGKSKEQPKQRKQSILEALDFSDSRSYEDAKLLSDAKYGKRKGEKMSQEQYQALRRKVGGTAKDYWKDWVDVKGDYVEKGYVGRQRSISESVPGLPFLIGTVVAIFAALGYVVSQTS